MADDEAENDLLASLHLTSSSSDSDGNGTDTPRLSARAARTRQTEEAFQEQRRLWKPVCAERVVHRDGAAAELRIRAEERYYMRDYPEAKRLALEALAVLAGVDVDEARRRRAERGELDRLVAACERKIGLGRNG